MTKPLNSRQKNFCALMAAGSSAGRAYEKAGYESQGNVADSAAERLMRKVEIKSRIAELREPVTKKLLLSKDRKREILRDIAEDTERPTMVRLRAVEIDAKLAGHFEPDRLDLNPGPKPIDSLRERALAIVSALDRNRRPDTPAIES